VKCRHEAAQEGRHGEYILIPQYISHRATRRRAIFYSRLRIEKFRSRDHPSVVAHGLICFARLCRSSIEHLTFHCTPARSSEMRAALRSVKNVVYQYNEVELKVREATNNDRYMVSNSQLAVLARATNSYQEYPSLFAMLWKRLTDLEHVMHVQKALIVVEYLIRHGAERFINDAKRRARDIAALQKYKHYDEQNIDDAKEARARAKAVYALLMDDQLLAQERGKSARLAGEGRLGGNSYADSYASNNASSVYGEEDHAYGGSNGYTGGGSTVNTGGGQRSRGHTPERSGSSGASNPARRSGGGASAATNLSRGAGASAVVRRRSVDEDPFENPVIPAAVSSSGGAKPLKSAMKGSSAAAAQAQAKGTSFGRDQTDPVDEAEAAKRAKKEKKRAKKEAAEKAAAEEEKRQAKAITPSARHGASSASPPAVNHNGAELDLMAYGNVDAPFGQGGGDAFDLLSGGGPGQHVAPVRTGGLDDLFANQSLHDHNGGGGDLFSSGGGNPFTSPEPAQTDYDGEQEGGFGGEGNGAGRRQSNGPDLHSPTQGGLINLDDLRAAPKSKVPAATVDSGVSMSMMRSIQPLGAPASSAKNSNGNGAAGNGAFFGEPLTGPAQKKRSNVPSSIPLGQNQVPQYGLQGFMAGPGMLGAPQMQMGYGGPQMGGYPGGGYPQQHPGMMMGGGYPQQGYPQQQQGPMLALMPPGAGSGYGHPPAPIAYGGGYIGASHPHPSSMPFGAAPSPSGASTFTQLRQRQEPNRAGGAGGGNGIPIFDVVEAQPARLVEPTNYMGGQGQSTIGQHGSRGQDYQSYYGQKNGGQQVRF
jgi:hypothetical protein